MMNCQERAKTLQNHSVALEWDGKITVFDTKRALLIGFQEPLIEKWVYLFRGFYGNFFLMLVDQIGIDPPKIEPVSESGARIAWNRMESRASLFRAFPEMEKTRRA